MREKNLIHNKKRHFLNSTSQLNPVPQLKQSLCAKTSHMQVSMKISLGSATKLGQFVISPLPYVMCQCWFSPDPTVTNKLFHLPFCHSPQDLLTDCITSRVYITLSSPLKLASSIGPLYLTTNCTHQQYQPYP